MSNPADHSASTAAPPVIVCEYMSPGASQRSFSVSIAKGPLGLSGGELFSLMSEIAGPTVTHALAVFDETINGLIRSREFLGLQLDHSWGNVSEADFESRAEEFLSAAQLTDAKAVSDKLAVLRLLPTAHLDSEAISAVFHCSIDIAQKALEIEREQRKLLPHG